MCPKQWSSLTSTNERCSTTFDQQRSLSLSCQCSYQHPLPFPHNLPTCKAWIQPGQHTCLPWLVYYIGVDLYLVVQAYIHTPKFNKWFGLVPFCMFVLQLDHACMLRSHFLHPCHASHVLFSFMGLGLLVFKASLFIWLHPLSFYGLFGCNNV